MVSRLALTTAVFLLAGCGSGGETPVAGESGGGGSGGASAGGTSATGGSAPGGATSGGGGTSSGGASAGGSSSGGASAGGSSNGGASAGGTTSGGVTSAGGSSSGGARSPGGDPADHFAGLKRRPDAPRAPVADCAGQPDLALCRVVTTPDRDYDVCVGGVCVSPGCGDLSCNVPSPHFEIPPSSHHTFLEKIPGNEPTVADLVTGLEWQACPSGTTGADCAGGAPEEMNKAAALAHCDQLSWGGKDDWYVPDAYELMSIFDFVKKPGYIDPAFFRRPEGGVWVTNGSGTSSSVVYFSEWDSFASSLLSTIGPDLEESVLCARRAASRDAGYTGVRFPPAVPDSREPVIVDLATGLSWQQCAPGETGRFCRDGATGAILFENEWLSYCDSLEWGGATDWRLPTYKELFSLMSFAKNAKPTLTPQLFSLIPSHPYIGVTSGWGSDAYTLLFDLSGAGRVGPNSAARYQVRCVRWTAP